MARFNYYYQIFAESPSNLSMPGVHNLIKTTSSLFPRSGLFSISVSMCRKTFAEIIKSFDVEKYLNYSQEELETKVVFAFVHRARKNPYPILNESIPYPRIMIEISD